MNPSVAAYILLLVTSVVFIALSLRKFKNCVECPFPRDFKPAMMAIFISLAWGLVAIQGLILKWGNSYMQLVAVDAPILLLLVCATLYTLLYALSNLYRGRCDEAEPKAGVVFPTICRTNSMGTRAENVRRHRPGEANGSGS